MFTSKFLLYKVPYDYLKNDLQFIANKTMMLIIIVWHATLDLHTMFMCLLHFAYVLFILIELSWDKSYDSKMQLFK